MHSFAARNLASDSILIRAQFSRTRHTQNSLCSANWYAVGATGTSQCRSFIAVTSSRSSRALPPEDEYREAGRGGKERARAIYYGLTSMVKTKFPTFPHPVNSASTAFPAIACPTSRSDVPPPVGYPSYKKLTFTAWSSPDSGHLTEIP